MALLLVLTSACALEQHDLSQGELARVGETVFRARDVAGVQSQLGAYAQLRFAGEEGRRQLLEALVETELLARAAIERGLGDDPRVAFALIEEIASVHESTELERRVPRQRVAEDEAALRRAYDTHLEPFRVPERRSMEGVVFERMDEADLALARLRAGEVELASLGELMATPLQARDDAEHPTFHPFLFAPGVGEGDWLPHPVILADVLLVGRVKLIDPERVLPFGDPAVQERLVEAVRAPLLAEARAELERELAARYPVDAPP